MGIPTRCASDEAYDTGASCFLPELFIGHLAGRSTAGDDHGCSGLPLLEALSKQVDVVDDRTFEESTELVGADAVGTFDLPVHPGASGSSRADALSSRCQWKAAPSSCPLSVCTCSIRNGSFDNTWPLNRTASLVVAQVSTQNPQTGAATEDRMRR